MLKTINITKHYYNQKNEQIKILDDVNFEVNKNEVVAILGPNGSGKSTLLKILANLEKTSFGKIERFDKLAHETTKCGIVFQNHKESLFPWKNVYKNIDFVVKLKNKNPNERRQKTEAILQKLNLTSHQHKYPYQLSGGLSQLTAFGRALAFEPEILFLDEPFSALDYHSSLSLQNQLNLILEEIKLPTILVTHSPDEAIKLADKIIILSSAPGKVVATIKNNIPRPRLTENFENSEYSLLKKQILENVKGFLI